MVTDISEALLRVLSQNRIVLIQVFFRTMFTTDIEESRIALEKYRAGPVEWAHL
jgi:hypothetical protein